MGQCLIAQISDLHISFDGQNIYEQVDSLAHLKQTVESLNGFKPSIDAVIISGDLADDGSSSAYELMFTELNKLNMPFFIVPGNHDSRTVLRPYLENNHPLANGEYLNWMLEDYPINIIGLDSLVEGEAFGLLASESLDFLERCLCKQKTKPTMVVLHHPPFDSGIEFMDEIKLKNPQEFEALISEHKQVIRVSCGHLHRGMQTSFAHSLLTVCPSTSHQMPLALDGLQVEARFTQEPPQFLLHKYSNGKLITHQLPIPYSGC